MFEVGARSGHPTATDVVAYAGIGLGFALVAMVGLASSTDLKATPATYSQTSSVVAPSFPTQYFGLRYFDGAVRDLCLVATADAPAGPCPRIRKNGVTYAVYLVDTTDPNASKLRFRTSAGTKAVRLKT